jgi:hypothetical protein
MQIKDTYTVQLKQVGLKLNRAPRRRAATARGCCETQSVECSMGYFNDAVAVFRQEHMP